MSAESDTDSFSTIQDSLECLTDLVGYLLEETASAEQRLTDFQRPMECIVLNQFGSTPFLAASPFRYEAFLIRPPGFPGADLTVRYPFKTICEILRNHLIQSGAVDADGKITLSAQLMKLFDIQESSVTYMDLIERMQTILF
jgi:hypothetical protein